MSATQSVSREEFDKLKAKVESLTPQHIEKVKKTREPSEYNIYIGQKCKEIKLQNPELKQSDVLKMAAGKWKNEKKIADVKTTTTTTTT